MVKMPSQMLPLGTQAPAFSLTDPSGKVHSLSDAASAPATLVVFMCNHCPYVKHIRSELAALGRECEARGVAMFGINSNDTDKYPDDDLAHMAQEVREHGYVFPYLLDESQEVAKAYQAACTPDFFVFDRDQRLAYRGQLDASRPGNDVPVTGADLRAALEAVLAGKPPAEDQIPSLGCNIKWKPGNEPDYFGI